MSDEKIDDEQDDDSAGLPPSVAERLTKYAERTKRDLDDMFTLFKVGIGIKLPTHALHIKDKTDPLKIEGLHAGYGKMEILHK